MVVNKADKVTKSELRGVLKYYKAMPGRVGLLAVVYHSIVIFVQSGRHKHV